MFSFWFAEVTKKRKERKIIIRSAKKSDCGEINFRLNKFWFAVGSRNAYDISELKERVEWKF